ncbi:MAG TPA: DUF4198 domain-containing protein [Chitinophagaceae bacterium]|nr:DUF4198 domain-containing protein [Chitinophagaceae bacterium]
MKRIIILCSLLLPGIVAAAQDTLTQPSRFIYRNREVVRFKFPSGSRSVELYYANVSDKLQQDSVEMSFFEPGTMMLAVQQGDSSHKIIFQVGDKHTGTYKRKTSLGIDIIPEENPYGIRDGEKLKAKVLRDGKPLAHAIVLVTHYNNDQAVHRELSTNDKGEVEFPVFVYGKWVFSASADKGTGLLVWGYLR